MYITFMMLKGIFLWLFWWWGKKQAKITNQISPGYLLLIGTGKKETWRHTYVQGHFAPTSTPTAHGEQQRKGLIKLVIPAIFSALSSAPLWVTAGGRWTLLSHLPFLLPPQIFHCAMKLVQSKHCSVALSLPGMWIGELCVYLQRMTWLPCKAQNWLP